MKRLEKLNELLKEEVSKIIKEEIEFPPGVLITITRVETSENKLASRVYFSFLAVSGEEDEESAASGLNKHIYRIQRILNRKLRIRPVPKIKFFIDEDEKRRERVEELLSASAENHGLGRG